MLPNPTFRCSRVDKIRLSRVFTLLLSQWQTAVTIVGSNIHGNLPPWIPDQQCTACSLCYVYFNLFTRRHHCRVCGGVFCHECCYWRVNIYKFDMQSVRACTMCFGTLQQMAFSPRNESEASTVVSSLHYNQTTLPRAISADDAEGVDFPADLRQGNVATGSLGRGKLSSETKTQPSQNTISSRMSQRPSRVGSLTNAWSHGEFHLGDTAHVPASLPAEHRESFTLTLSLQEAEAANPLADYGRGYLSPGHMRIHAHYIVYVPWELLQIRLSTGLASFGVTFLFFHPFDFELYFHFPSSPCFNNLFVLPICSRMSGFRRSQMPMQRRNSNFSAISVDLP